VNVVVVDDGSRDDTLQVALGHKVWVLRHRLNCGQGAALQTGIEFALRQGAEILRVERGPWEAEIPLDDLAAAPFPKLVFSGRHHAAFEAVCDVLQERLGAERAAIPGAGHSVQRTGAPFNERLEAFLDATEGR
jgi:hypothetical protein